MVLHSIFESIGSMKITTNVQSKLLLLIDISIGSLYLRVFNFGFVERVFRSNLPIIHFHGFKVCQLLYLIPNHIYFRGSAKRVKELDQGSQTQTDSRAD